MMWRRLVIVLALSLTAACADYQVVLKSSGKIIHGAFLYEDADSITLQLGNAEVPFKKENLDLVRMKELNQSQPAAGPQPGAGDTEPLEGQALIRELEKHIAERERILATYRTQPPSDERDRHILELEKELLTKRKALVELKLGYGTSGDPEVEQLQKRFKETFAEAEEAKQAYDSLPANAPQSEADARWERLRSAEKQWSEAKDALTKALQESGSRN